MASKKYFIFFSAVGALISYVLLYSDKFAICHSRECVDFTAPIAILLIIFYFVFIFSVLFAWTKEEVYKSWSKFAAICVGITVVIGAILPGDNGGGNLVPFPSMRGLFVIVMIFVFVVTSLVTVLYKSWKLRGT